jgi:hypothetical protein
MSIADLFSLPRLVQHALDHGADPVRVNEVIGRGE